MRKHKSKVVGLVFMAALGLMAFAAAAAQAEEKLELGDHPETGEPGFVLSEGTERPTGLTKETVSGKMIGSRTVLIPAKKTEITCEAAEVTEGFTQNEYESWKTGTMKKGGYGQGTVKLSSCRVFEITQTGSLIKEIKACSEGLDPIIVKGSGWLKRHEGKTYGIVEPFVNSKSDLEKVETLAATFGILEFGELCPFPSKITLSGSFAVEAPAKDAVKPSQSIDTFSEAGKVIQSLLGMSLKFGTSEAFIKSEGTGELTGSGIGLAWGRCRDRRLKAAECKDPAGLRSPRCDLRPPGAKEAAPF